MKIALAFNMVGCLIGIALLLCLGHDYEFVGYGLHPAICGLGIVALLAAGYASAKIIDDLEHADPHE